MTAWHWLKRYVELHPLCPILMPLGRSVLHWFKSRTPICRGINNLEARLLISYESLSIEICGFNIVSQLKCNTSLHWESIIRKYISPWIIEIK